MKKQSEEEDASPSEEEVIRIAKEISEKFKVIFERLAK